MYSGLIMCVMAVCAKTLRDESISPHFQFRYLHYKLATFVTQISRYSAEISDGIVITILPEHYLLF